MKSLFLKLNFALGMMLILINSAAAIDQGLPGSTPPIPAPFNGTNYTNKNTDINDRTSSTNAEDVPEQKEQIIVKPLPGTTPPVSVLSTPNQSGVYTNKPLPGTTPPVSVLTTPPPNK